MFNPFKGVALNELAACHLPSILEVREGWFIEYKRQPCKAKDYAKAVSAFANAKGGWIFVGIAEDENECPSANSPGIPTDDMPKLLDTARNGIAQNLSPVPQFDIKVIDGPVPKLGIVAGRSIIVVRVPPSAKTPHIHGSGQIFRRIANASCSVIDRTELDELYRRAEKHCDLIDEVLDLGFDERSSLEVCCRWIHLAVIPDPSKTSRANRLSHSRFRDIVSNRSSVPFIALPVTYSSPLGHVARNHTLQSNLTGAATTFEYGRSGEIFVTLPLSVAQKMRGASIDFLETENGQRFSNLIDQHRYPDSVQVIDGTSIVMAFICFQNLASNLQSEQEIQGPFFRRLKGRNFLNSIPYFDSKSYVDWCEESGIPVVHRDGFQVPVLSRDWEVCDEVSLGKSIFQLLFSLGIPEDILEKIVGETSPYFTGNEET